MSELVVSKNKHVMFSYNIIDADSGAVLEQIEIPMSYIHGGEQKMYEKVEAAMEGAKIGDEIETTLKPDEAFGPADQTLIFSEDLNNVPSQFHRVGAEVEFQNETGEVKSFVVTKIEEGKITIDGNNPLVGKNLTFRVHIHDVREATAKEIESGTPAALPSLH